MPDGGRVWRLALHSRSALSLNVLFEEFELPVDSELYVRSLLTLEGGDGQEPEIMGPFTQYVNVSVRVLSRRS